MIDLVRPALPAIATFPIWHEWGETSGRDGLHSVEIRNPFERTGLVLGDAFFSKNDETGNRGSLGGDRLYLLVDGDLAVARWQGEWDRYEAKLKRVTPREAMEEWYLEECLKQIQEVLQRWSV